VFNSTGKQVAEVWDLTNRSITWHTDQAAPGMYFYEIRTGEKVFTGPITVAD
jgi:hypothetical protein